MLWFGIIFFYHLVQISWLILEKDQPHVQPSDTAVRDPLIISIFPSYSRNRQHPVPFLSHHTLFHSARTSKRPARPPPF